MIPVEFLKFVSLPYLTSPYKDGPLLVYKNRWWLIDTREQAFYFIGAKGKFNTPVCSSSLQLAERLALSYDLVCTPVFVSWAYEKFNISDYA